MQGLGGGSQEVPEGMGEEEVERARGAHIFQELSLAAKGRERQGQLQELRHCPTLLV